MTRALAIVCALLVAAIALGGSLWRRDVQTLADIRADLASARQSVAQASKRHTRCLGLVDAERAAVERCQRDAEDSAREARATERAACNELVKAAEARGALDVERTDVRAVVEALRRRRRASERRTPRPDNPSH